MKSIRHTRSFEISEPIDRVFPLFSPEGEKKWVPGWDYENVTGSTEISEDHVFLTKNHDHAAADAVWIVKKHDPKSHYVQFYKIEPGEKIGLISIECLELESQRTQVQVTYHYTAFSSSGEMFVSGFDGGMYEKFIDERKMLLSDYFKRKSGQSKKPDAP